MARQTNLQKCQDILREGNKLEQDFLSACKLSIPEKVYIVQCRKVYEVTTRPFLKLDTFIFLGELGSKVTGKDLKKYEDWLACVKRSIDVGILNVNCKGKQGSWSQELDTLVWYDTEDKAQVVAEEATKVYNETYQAKEGQFNCSYCRKATDDDEKVSRLLYLRTGGGTMYEMRDYCSTSCGSSDQMAHER